MADVTLPSLGESVTGGIITRWFKHVGDSVARDEPLFEVSTDKVDSEMPSPAAGILTEILANEGDTVETGSRVAVIDDRAAYSPASAPQPVEAAHPAAPTARAEVAVEAANGVVVSPVVRRILADGGIDASGVRGSGPGGAITRRDAERAVAQGPDDEVVVALSNGRRRMGAHMAASFLATPRGFVAIEVDAEVFGALESLGRVTRDGAPISDELVVALAAVRALSEFEHLNATFADDELIVHRSVNLGFVRAMADGGMLVPVVHAAGGLTLRALARRVADLDERIASRRLTADDLMGGTFTVAGAPSEHTLWSESLIIQPEVAVLSVGAVRSVPVVTRGDDGPSIAVGRRVVLGLSFDHRVCEPVAAARYLERVAELLARVDLESER